MLNNEQYERLALWLDGEKVALGEEELAAAREIRSGERRLRTVMGEEAAPGRAMARARRRLRSATGARAVLAARYVGVAAAALAVAAAIVIVLAVRMAGPGSDTTGLQPLSPIAKAPEVPLDVWLRASEGPPGGEAIHLLAGEIDQFEAELAVTKGPAVMDRQIDSVQQDIDNFWTEDSSPETPQG